MSWIQTGNIGFLRMNQLFPPFDNPAIRRALLGAIEPGRFHDRRWPATIRSMWRDDVGLFCPGTPMASDAGMAALTGPRDLERARKRRSQRPATSGERVAIMTPSDYPRINALANVAADMMTALGLNVDLQATDWGTVMQRRASKGAVDKGGWSVFITTFTGTRHVEPGRQSRAARQRREGVVRLADAPDASKRCATRGSPRPTWRTQQRSASDIQRQFWIDVPHFPLGQYFQPTSYRTDLEGVLDGFATFWNVRRSG